MEIVKSISGEVGTKRACQALGVARASYYRGGRPKLHGPVGPRARPRRALAAEERLRVLDALHSERFVDTSPAAMCATLLEEGTWHCSVRTMYRLLAAEGEVGERRNQLRHPNYAKPELLATGPNQVWSWDLTKLRAPEKWSYYHLYVLRNNCT